MTSIPGWYVTTLYTGVDNPHVSSQFVQRMPIDYVICLKSSISNTTLSASPAKSDTDYHNDSSHESRFQMRELSGTAGARHGGAQ